MVACNQSTDSQRMMLLVAFKNTQNSAKVRKTGIWGFGVSELSYGIEMIMESIGDSGRDRTCDLMLRRHTKVAAFPYQINTQTIFSTEGQRKLTAL